MDTRLRGALTRTGISLLALLPWPVLAVDLDPIQLRSRIGEPLLAEIRVRDVPPEASTLTARLPDPVVFARIGLPRPRGAVSELRFDVRRNDRGGAVIRITSAQPVTEDFLTFLVQVEWPQGSLVREFSVALPDAGAPAVLPAVSSAEPPPAEAPDAAPAAAVDPAAVGFDGPALPSATGIDAAPATAGATPAADPIPLAPSPPQPAPAPPQAAATPPVPTTDDAQPIAVVPRPGAAPPRPAAPVALADAPGAASPRERARAIPAAAPPPPTAPTAAPAPRAASPMPASGTVTVARGSHLTGIARRALPADVPLEAALVGLLIANPDAFVDGNLHRLRQGAILRLPSPETLRTLDLQRAREVVALQTETWQGGDDPARQARAEEALAALAQEMAPRAAPRPARATTTASPRIKIVPPAEPTGADDPSDATSQLPRDAGLQEETVAARDEEIRHLQQRIAQLEQSNAEQRRLLSMQNDAMEQAQRHLQPGDAVVAAGVLRSPAAWLAATATLCVLVMAWALWRRRRPAATGKRAASWQRDDAVP